MFCSKCGKEIPAGTQTCANCGAVMSGAAPTGAQTPIVINNKQNGGGGCIKGCFIALLILIGAFGVLGVFISGVASRQEKEEKVAIAAQRVVSPEEATKNAEDLIAWAKGKSGQTDLVRDEAFDRLKGKTVILKGVVREVGKTMFSEDYYVSLKVGKISAFENLNIQFTMRESQYDKFKTWNKGEVHTLRGRISGQGDLEDDAECDLGEIVE